MEEEENNEPMPNTNQTQARIVTNTSFVTKEEEANLYIGKMLRKLEKSLKPRLKLK